SHIAREKNVADEKSVVGVIGLSEKQYQISTRGARNCRFFLSSLPVLDRTLSPPSRTTIFYFFDHRLFGKSASTQRHDSQRQACGEARRSLHSARMRLGARL